MLFEICLKSLDYTDESKLHNIRKPCFLQYKLTAFFQVKCGQLENIL